MKKILIFCLLIISALSYGQLDTINIGTAPNDGTGESLRSGMIKVNIAIRQINTLTTGSTNWNTAYTDRLKWDGGATGLTAATGRTSLGATTVGAAFFMLTNPSAITFVRINADNTISALSAANFKTALSLSSTDVGLNNVTNNAQVELADSGVWSGGYVTPYDLSIAIPAGAVLLADSGVWSNGYITPYALNIELGDYMLYGDSTIYLTPYDLQTELGDYVLYSDSSTIFVTPYDLTLEDFVVPGDSDVIFATPYDLLAAALSYLAIADSGTAYITPTDLAEAIAPFEDTVALETIVTLQSDSNAFVATFGLGSGQLSDTTAFNNNALIGSTTIPPSDTIHGVNLSCKIMEGSGTESVTVNICWDNDSIMSAIPIKLNTSGYTVANLRIENNDASFNNNDIPPGSVLYGYISGITAGNKPSYLECTFSGYKYNRAY